MIEAKRKPAQRVHSPELESEFERWFIREALAQTGWHFAYHVRRSDKAQCRAGFPDWIIGSERQRRVIFAELKRDNTKPTPDQENWIRFLRLCGHECHVWRPRDREEVLKVLSGKETSDER